MIGLLLLFSVCCHGYTNEAIGDKIESLPGAETLEINFQQFSGYIQGDQNNRPLSFFFAHL
jgi:hypothetical protein